MSRAPATLLARVSACLWQRLMDKVESALFFLLRLAMLLSRWAQRRTYIRAFLWHPRGVAIREKQHPSRMERPWRRLPTLLEAAVRLDALFHSISLQADVWDSIMPRRSSELPPSCQTVQVPSIRFCSFVFVRMRLTNGRHQRYPQLCRCPSQGPALLRGKALMVLSA